MRWPTIETINQPKALAQVDFEVWLKLFFHYLQLYPHRAELYILG